METIKFILPKDKEAHNVIASSHDGYVEVNYELKDKWTPKDGDFVSLIYEDIQYFLIYKQKVDFRIEGYAVLNLSIERLFIDSYVRCWKPIIKPATEEEKQQLLNAMHEKGKDWDAENKKIVEYRWEPNIGDDYYYITEYMIVCKNEWHNTDWDNTVYNRHNCFCTKEEAMAMRDKLQKVLNGAKIEEE